MGLRVKKTHTEDAFDDVEVMLLVGKEGVKPKEFSGFILTKNEKRFVMGVLNWPKATKDAAKER